MDPAMPAALTASTMFQHNDANLLRVTAETTTLRDCLTIYAMNCSGQFNSDMLDLRSGFVVLTI